MLFEGRGLVKNFGGLAAVNDLDIGVRSGEVLGLIGPNGCGKTTVINLLSGTLPLTSGKVLLEGKDITRCSPHTHAQMGIVRTFQLNNLIWDYTVMDNLRSAFYSRHQMTMARETVTRSNSSMAEGGYWSNKALGLLEEFGIAHMN